MEKLNDPFTDATTEWNSLHQRIRNSMRTTRRKRKVVTTLLTVVILAVIFFASYFLGAHGLL